MAVYFEAAAVITVLVLMGQVLELKARARTGGAIRALLDLAPKTARRVDAQGNEADVLHLPEMSSLRRVSQIHLIKRDYLMKERSILQQGTCSNA